jgi:hypothetical protein
MRISVKLPNVKPGEYERPEECVYARCEGRRFKRHGREGERKPQRDVRTFRVYPAGR